MVESKGEAKEKFVIVGGIKISMDKAEVQQEKPKVSESS